MKQIGSLFEKYKEALRPPQATVEREAAEIIREVTGIEIKSDQLSYTTASRTLKINAPSVVRTEVMRRKGEVLAALSQSLGTQHSPRELL